MTFASSFVFFSCETPLRSPRVCARPCFPCRSQAARHREAVDKLKASRNKGFEVLSAKHQSAMATVKAEAAAAQVADICYIILEIDKELDTD